MRATEFIRELLDLIDSVDQAQEPVLDYAEENECDPEAATQYANTPDEQITSTSVILSMGNDVNKPKNPSDIRSDSFSMYPNWQARK